MDILLLTAGEIAVALILVSTFLLSYTILRDYVHLVLWRRRTYAQPPRIPQTASLIQLQDSSGIIIAEIRPSGSWQYPNDFFNKITEFRNDFA